MHPPPKGWGYALQERSMRQSVREPLSFFSVAAFVVFGMLSLSAGGQSVHPIESRLRREFPAVALGSPATTFDSAEGVANGRAVSGLRARFAAPAMVNGLPPEGAATTQLAARENVDAGLRILYPHVFSDDIVAEAGGQRVVLRATGARSAAAQVVNGKLFYEGVYSSVDAMEVPYGDRSEELLLLRDDRAPLIYEYEIVEMEGVAGVLLHDGAIRFMPPAPAIQVSRLASGTWEAPTPSLEIARPWVVDATGRRSESAARWSLGKSSDEGQLPRTIRLTLTGDLTYPLVVDPSFSTTGSMLNGRQVHTATLLPNGKVLIAAGYPAFNDPRLYDPARGTFSTTGSMVTSRMEQSATMLPNGKVLIAGGYYAGTAAELYDPASGTFTSTGSLNASRYDPTATLLPNGKVLIAGGATDGTATSINSAELYDPASGTFTLTGSMTTARTIHTATLLPNGKVLIAGGYGVSGLASAELYDPANGTFSLTGTMAVTRGAHTATLLANGQVLVAGGSTGTTAELYNPASGTFSGTGPLSTARFHAKATLLPGGDVLITGGSDGSGSVIYASAELYNPAGGTFSLTSSMAAARDRHSATLLPDGRVLIAGGRGPLTQGLSSAELYDPAAGAFSTTGVVGASRVSATATPLLNGKVLVAGGTNLPLAELYDPATGTFSATGTPGTSPRFFHTATLLANGKVLVAGGGGSSGGGSLLTSAELYDSVSGTFSPTGSLITARSFHSATLLPNGKVLLASGSGGGTSAELYDPVSGTFSAAGPLVAGRFGHAATLLPNGKVLITGGSGANAELYDPASGPNGLFSAIGATVTSHSFHTSTLLANGKVLIAGGSGTGAELYDPASGPNGTFTATGPMVTARNLHTATMLSNGKVLFAGGYNGSNLALAELYDPASGTFSATGSLGVARFQHTATLLPNAKVLVFGGNGGGTSAEVYDTGDGYLDSRRPVISVAPASIMEPASITISGTGFLGDSEASGGATNNSATNFPLLQLVRVDNEQQRFVLPGAAWSDTSFTSIPLVGLTGGYYRTTVITNGIPSLNSVVLILGPTITNTSPNACLPVSGGSSITLTGTNLLNGTVTVNGNPATVTSTTATTVVFTTPAGTAASQANVIVTTTGGTAPTSFVYATPTPTISAGGTTTFCAGGSVTLTSSSASGNQWSLDGNPIGGATNTSYIASMAGNYTVVATVSGCASPPSAISTVTVNPIPPTPGISAGGATTFCTGGSVTLTSSSASGNQWLRNGTAIGGATNQTYSATIAGNYTVTVTATGCTSPPSAATTVTVNPLPATPVISAGGPTTFCDGEDVALTSSSASAYQWSRNGNPIGGASGQIYNATASGNYTVIVTDGNGCPSAPSAATTVTVNPIPETPTITPGGPTAFCNGGNVTLTSSSGSGYQWYLNGNPIGGATNQAYVASGNGDYSVTVTSTGCTSAPSPVTTVTVNPIPDATITASASVTTGSTGNPASVANAGIGATYNWGITNGTITAGTGTAGITFTAGVVGTLTLNVTVTTGAGCTDSESANADVGYPPVIITSVTPPNGTSLGGTPVTIAGSGFDSGATVTFGSAAATNVVVSATQITATTPAHAAGAANVTVTNTNATTGTLNNGYTYVQQIFDVNDDGVIDPGDIFYLVAYLFTGGPPPVGPAGILSGDANGDGVVDPSDIFYLVNYLFRDGPAPLATSPRKVATTSTGQPLSGALTLGPPVRRKDHWLVPVILTMDPGSSTPQALSLRVQFKGNAATAVMHRGAVLAPLFEISRRTDGSIAYLVAFEDRGPFVSGNARQAVIAEIELSVRGDTSLELDPRLTMLVGGDGDKATVENHALRLNGTSIETIHRPEGERSPHDQ
ncbi:MAG: kelch repeat-containing protein [Acidobacteriota bacterium]